MKHAADVTLLVELPLIIREKPWSLTPAASHPFEFQPVSVGHEFWDEVGAQVHGADFIGLGRFHLPAHGRGPFNSDCALTDIQVSRLQRDRFAGSQARFSHDAEEHSVARVQDSLVSHPHIFPEAYCHEFVLPDEFVSIAFRYVQLLGHLFNSQEGTVLG